MGKKKQAQKKRGDVDAFESNNKHTGDHGDVFDNPIAVFEDEAAAEEASENTFTDDSRPTHLARADVIAEGGASILTDRDAGAKGCLSWLFETSMNKGGGYSGSPSVVQFDAMQLMDDDSADPQLHDHAGTLVSFAQPKGLKVSGNSLRGLPKSTDGDGDDEDEVGLVAQLERELADIQNEIKKRHKWEDGRAVDMQRKDANHKLVERVKQTEASLREEKARLRQEHEVTLAAADKVAESAGVARSTASHDAAIQRLQGAGKKVIASQRGVAAMGAQPNVFTVEEHGPLGIDWHYQDDRPVVVGIRDGGCAEKIAGLRIGMVLSQYRQPRLGLKAKVTYDRVKEEAKKRYSGSDEIPSSQVVEHLQLSLEVIGRPLQLVFETPGAESDLLERQLEERLSGCKIEDLKYVIPKTGLALGGIFFKSPHGTVLCDIDADSVLGSHEFQKEGMRPGLVLKQIKTADGFTRCMNNDEYSHIQVMKQLAVAKRPYVCSFEPKAVPMEFMLDDSSKDKTVPSPSSDSDKQYTKHCRGSNFNIFRHLGLSLREEVLIVDRAGGGFGALSTDETKWRCRVSGVVPGGMIDRFNRHHTRGWITPGMTLTNVQSPFCEPTNVDGMRITQVVELFHRAAAGQEVAHTGKDGNKTVYSGKTITLGFEVKERATVPDIGDTNAAFSSSSEEEEEETDSDDEE